MRIFKIILVIFVFNLRIQQATCDTQVYKRVDSTTFPNSSWTNPYTQVICNQNDAEFNQVMLGNFQLARGSTANTLNIQNLPPHFEVNFRVDIYIIETWDNETVSIIAGSQGQTLSNIQYDHNKASQKWQKICFTGSGPFQGQKINYFQRNEHTLTDANSNFSISFKTDCRKNTIFDKSGCEDISNESFAIGQLQVFVNECHFSCLSCSGPSSNQCKSCFNNINPTNGVCPLCSGVNSIFDNGACVSSCSSGKINKNQVCIFGDPFCQTYQQNGYDCQQCQANYFLWNGICVSTCPLFYDNINNICQDQIRSLPQGFVALEGLQRQRFSSFHILQLGFSIQNLNPSNSKLFFQGQNTKYTICGDIQLLGGFRSGVTQTKFTINVQLSQTRKFLQIGFKFYLVDYSQNNPIPNILVNLNGVSVQIVNSQYIKRTSFNLCGFEQNDAYGEFKYVLTDSVSTNLSVTIDNQSNFDIGIRDFLVGGYSCADSCQSCSADNPSSCLSCYNSFYLLGDKCVTDCPSGQYQDKVLNQCIQCSATFPNCKICDKNQCLICQNSYYFTSSNNCVTCSLSPVKQYWDPINLQCSNTCSSGLQPDDQNQICRNKCDDSACLICDPSSQNFCQQCLQGHYLYNNSCVQSCPLGTSLDNTRVQCLSCNDPLCLSCNIDASNTPICQKCIDGKYLDTANSCQSCDLTCQTCDGGQPTQCLSCNSLDLNIVYNSDKTCTCKSVNYSFDSSTKLCKTICGDKFKTPEEECETFDNSFSNASGCDSECKIVPGYKCFHQDPYPLDICTNALCGDGKLDPSENCDDGNNSQKKFFFHDLDQFNKLKIVNGDGCSLDCQTETGFSCQTISGKSQCSSICGDNLVTLQEECDSNDAGCDQLTCKIKANSGCSYTKYNYQLQISNCFSCDDQFCMKCIQTDPINQTCLLCQENYFFDTNSKKCLGCDPSCQTCFGPSYNQCKSCFTQKDSKVILDQSTNTCICNSQYYYYDDNSQICTPICNDQHKTPEEQCEVLDSSLFDNSKCVNCKVQSGYKCFSNQDFDLDICTTIKCGDGIRNLDEQCDDGNQINNDYCSLNCKIQQGYSCKQDIGSSLLQCQSTCGDRIKSSDEECDSADLGCSANCKVMSNYGCYIESNLGSSVEKCFKCQDPNCLKCTKIYNTVDSTYDEICAQCQDGYYMSIISNKCEKCDSSCKTCNGPSANNCSSCLASPYVVFDPITKQCTCMNNYYSYDFTSNKCIPVCGDKHKTPEEECEVLDSSLFDNSKCVNCKVQSGYKCFSNQGYNLDICTTAKCGDGIRDSDEQCDDGNQINNDYCSLNCKVQQGYSCKQDIGSSNLICQSTCGDRIKSSDEECDSSDMGCSANCKIMNYYGCFFENNIGSSIEKCFKCQDLNCLKCTKVQNSVSNNYEETCSQCQEGFYFSSITKKCEKCDSSCKTCNGPSASNCSSCFANPYVVFDPISAQCRCINNYYSYDFTSNKCSPVCGDKHKTPEEECEVNDQTAFSNSQGCIQCKIQAGYKCIHINNIELDVCMLSTCQNGVLDSGEQCDDGNINNCSLDCKVNLGYQCSQTTGQGDLKCKEKCGDSLKSNGEECDPPGIGCNSNCQIMPGYRCEQVEIQNSLTNFKPTQCFKCKLTNCQKCEIINNVEICLICESNFFLDTQSNQCQKCHSSCLSCKGAQAVDCLTCPDDKSILFVNGSCKKCDITNGLYFNSLSQKCEELCGKGFMLTEKVLQSYGLTKIIECDDGNNVNNDGCSQICKIENGFKCTNSVKKDQHFISLSLCTTLTDGPTPYLKLEEQYVHLQNYYQIQGEIFFDRQILISSIQNIISYLDVQNSQDYEIKIFTEDVILNILMTQTIKIQIKIYKPMKNVNIFIKFKQSDIIDKFDSFLLKKSISSQLPQIEASSQDTYGNNIFAITVLNAFLGFLIYFMLFFVPFNTVVTLFDLLQSVNYLKFLNVNYSKELYVFLRIFDFANFEFFPNINAKNAAVPLTFQREQVDSFLFSNLIQTILVWALFLVFYLLSFGYKKLKIKTIKFIDNLMNKIYTNFFFKIASGIVVFTFYEITLCIWLQLNDVQSETSVKSMIGVIFAVIFLTSQILIVHLGLNKSKKEDFQNGIQKIIQNIQSKFQQFTISNFIKKYYFINGFILIRKIIYIFLLIYSQSNKVQQIVFVQLLFSLETIIIIIKRPYLEAKMNQIQIFTHINFLVALFSITWLVYDDITNNFSTQVRHILSAVCIIPISLIFLKIIIHLFQTLKENIQFTTINLSKIDLKQQNQNL